MGLAQSCAGCGGVYIGETCPTCAGRGATKPAPVPAPGPVRLEGYELLEPLGRGGMGVVYRARQKSLDRVVALKLLPRERSGNVDFEVRFEREAKALAALSHTNIVTVHDFGRQDDQYYLAMELVEGSDLRTWMSKGLSPARAVEIAAEICEALDFAHSKGVVHRDIKPENVLIDAQGRVKIADFGLARLLGLHEDQRLTQSEAVLGTMRYVSPEQLDDAAKADPRSDLYSLGVMLYEMLTGKIPAGKFAPPSATPGVPAHLDAPILRALEMDPAKRQAGAAEFRRELTAPAPAPPPPVSRRPAWILRTGVAALPVAVLLAVLLLRPRGNAQPPPPERLQGHPSALDHFSFAENEGPKRETFAEIDLRDVRNPFRIAKPEEKQDFVRLARYLGINLDAGKLRGGYAALWPSGTVIAVEGDEADALEGALRERIGTWVHRKGDFLAAAMSSPRNRAAFVELVTQAQRKLGLPQAEPDLPLSHFHLRHLLVPIGWTPASAPPGTETLVPKEVEGAYSLGFGRGSSPTLGFLAVRSQHPESCSDELRTRVARLKPVKFEVRTGKNSACLLFLLDEEYGAFEYFARGMRMVLGLPERTFETIVPTERELSGLFVPATTSRDAASVVASLGIRALRAEEFVRVWYAKSLEGGEMLIAEIPSSDRRNALWKSLSGWTVTIDAPWLIGVRDPDPTRAKAAFRRLREKLGEVVR